MQRDLVGKGDDGQALMTSRVLGLLDESLAEIVVGRKGSGLELSILVPDQP